MFFIDFIKWNPLISILAVSIVLTFLLTWVYKLTINYKKYKELTDRQKALGKEIKSVKEPKRLEEIQNEMMQLSMQSFKMSLKPMIITFIPVIIIFALLRSAYTTAKIGDILHWGFNIPLVGTGGGWFFCYFVFSLVMSFVARKILKF